MKFYRIFILSFLFYQTIFNSYAVNKVFGYDWSWILDDVEKVFGLLDQKAIDVARAQYTKDPNCLKQAQIRQSNDLCREEKDYSDQRLVKVKKTLEKITRTNLDSKTLPKIAIAGSGGGYRAMLNTLGSLLGLEAIGLKDTILYMSGVSGSTWAMAPWIQSGQTLENLKEFYIQQLESSFITYHLDYESVSSQLFSKWLFNEPYSLVDIYGMLLSQHLLGICSSNPLDLSYQAKLISNGDWPMPIYSSVIRTKDYEWCEFTPFEVGSDYLNAYIPSWSFGRQFNAGTSANFSNKYGPALPLGYCLGTWSSAFAYLLSKPGNDKPYLKKEAMDAILTARVCNWNYNVANAYTQNEQYLELADSGVFINYDLNSLLRRNVDIIILLDASSDLTNIDKLKYAENYWKQYFKIPTFDYSNITKNISSVFKDENNPDLPIIIYMPQIKNPNSSFDPASCLNSFCNILNFVYTKDQAQAVIDNATLNMVDSASIIINEIQDKIKAKNSIK